MYKRQEFDLTKNVSSLNNYYGSYEELALLVGCAAQELKELLLLEMSRLRLLQIDILVECFEKTVRIELCDNARDMRRSGYIVPRGAGIIGKPGSFLHDCFTSEEVLEL